MKPISRMITTYNHTKGRKGKTIQYIVIHYTANNGDTARGNALYFSKPNRNASAHYFVDPCAIVQVVEDSNTAWSVGANKYIHPHARNENTLNIEMCSLLDSRKEYYFDTKTIENTIELVVYLMQLYNIPIENVIRHYDVTGKSCPAPFVASFEQWLNLKKRIDTKLKEATIVQPKKLTINEHTFNAVNIDGENYVRLRDIPDIVKTCWEHIEYDPHTKAIKI